MSYLPVSSNDTLSHKALQGSPETLCGKPAVGLATASNVLICDVCATLAGGDSILKETTSAVGDACWNCSDGVDDAGYDCWNCDGGGVLDAGQSNAIASKTAQLADEGFDPDKAFDAQDIVLCDNCNDPTSVSKRVGNEQWCMNCALAPTSTNTQYRQAKTATNWTRDGVPIEDGFDVIIDTQQASRTPFLDYTRVAVSEKRECPDCNTEQWLSKVAQCADCNGIKCKSCMETVGIDSFFGTCKKCAGADVDLDYSDDYESTDQDRYLTYLFNEPEEQTDPLFLPGYPTE